MINGHGDDLYNFSRIRMNFSSNINPHGLNEELLKHLKDSLSDIVSYPEPLPWSLAKRIENSYELAPDSVLITNGAVEAFYLVAAVQPAARSLIYTPSFAEYADACLKGGHDVVYLNNAVFPGDVSFSDFDYVWICNPNNPDGKIFDPEELMIQIGSHSNTVFVVDEAYVEFTGKSISLEKQIRDFPNLIVVRSMTKRHAIPGLRLGYVVTSPARIEQLQSCLMPWRVNALALKAGMHCLSDEYDDAFDVSSLLRESRRLQRAIGKIDGFRVHPSESIFFLVNGPAPAAEVKKYLVTKYGILIRNAANFRDLSENHFRVSVQSPKENNQLIKALEQWN